MFYVWFAGNSTKGEWVNAHGLNDAKWIFAIKHGLKNLSYVKASRKAAA